MAHDWFVRGNLRRESCCPGCGRAGDPDLTSTIRSMLSTTTRDKATDKGKKKKRKRKKRKESPVASEEQRRNRRHNVINAAVAV